MKAFVPQFGAALACAITMVAGISCRQGARDAIAGSETAETLHAAPPDPSAACGLPDLSHVTPPAREQIRHAFDSLEAARHSAESGRVRSVAYGRMGILLLAAEYTDAAEPCFVAAAQIEPVEFRWSYYLGHVYYRRSQLDKSAEAFERVRQMQPDYVAASLFLGEVSLAQGRLDAAERAFSSALGSPAHKQAALFGLGRAALARRDHAKAVEQLEAALSIDSRATAIHYPLAMAYNGLDQTARAGTHLLARGDMKPPTNDPLMDAVREELQSAGSFDFRARQALGRADWVGAAAAARAGIELASGDSRMEARLRHRLGTALAQTGDARGALEQFQQAVRLAPDLAGAHYSLGVLLQALGRRGDAIAHFSTALKHDPNYTEARDALTELKEASAQHRQPVDAQ